MAEASSSANTTVEWLRDYIVQCMQSPSWTIPLGEFIDEHCMKFEDTPENKLEYTQIHSQFRDLVDRLLEEHLAELSINRDLFAQVFLDAVDEDDDCGIVLRRLIASEDFLHFKELMLSRRRELEQGGSAIMMTEIALTTRKTNCSKKHYGRVFGWRIKKKGLHSSEEEEIQRAIELSLLEHQNDTIEDAPPDPGGDSKRSDARHLAMIAHEGNFPASIEPDRNVVADASEVEPSNDSGTLNRGRPTKEEIEARAEHLRRQRELFKARMASDGQRHDRSIPNVVDASVAETRSSPPNGIGEDAEADDDGVRGSDLRKQLTSSLMKARSRQGESCFAMSAGHWSSSLGRSHKGVTATEGEIESSWAALLASEEESNRVRETQRWCTRHRHKKGKRIPAVPAHRRSCPELISQPLNAAADDRRCIVKADFQRRGTLKAVWRRKLFAHDIEEPPSWEATTAVEKDRWDPQPFRLPRLETLRATLPRELASTDQGYPNSVLGYYKSVKKQGDEVVEAAARNPDVRAPLV
ncbi:hypothetical protein FOZ60_012103 [Perkinsus olseni]|uniref:Cilia- and flagella-associated protein 36 n=1 Tax=Perkinsus olseni TaxID=32597 RepID=A0A7J6NC33_PEROL|nr:hypothetical protein FOZ60_012103 [Perkinsus olseni]